MAIDLSRWNETYSFNDINIHTDYQVTCGLGDSVNLQSTLFEYYTATQFIQAVPRSIIWTILKFIAIVGLLGLGVMVGMKFIKKPSGK